MKFYRLASGFPTKSGSLLPTKRGRELPTLTTAKENGLDPYRYLLWLLQNAPGLSETDEAWAEKLLPARARKNAICRKNR